MMMITKNVKNIKNSKGIKISKGFKFFENFVELQGLKMMKNKMNFEEHEERFSLGIPVVQKSI